MAISWTTTTTVESSVNQSYNVNQSKLTIYQGYGMFIGLAVVSFFVARGALAIRYHIYKDKVRYNISRSVQI